MAVHVLIRNRDIRITQPGIQKDSAGDCIDLNRSKHLRLLFIAADFIEAAHSVQNIQHLCNIFVSIHMPNKTDHSDSGTGIQSIYDALRIYRITIILQPQCRDSCHRRQNKVCDPGMADDRQVGQCSRQVQRLDDAALRKIQTGDRRAIEIDVLDIRAAMTLEQKATIPEVIAAKETLAKAKSDTFWNTATLPEIDKIREEMRGLMHFLKREIRHKIINVTDQVLFEREGEEFTQPSNLESYYERARRYVDENYDEPALNKLRNNIPLDEEDWETLERIFWSEVGTAEEYKREIHTADDEDIPLGKFVRSLTGLDKATAEQAFNEFLDTGLYTQEQITFVRYIIDWLVQYGTLARQEMAYDEFSGGMDVTEVFEDNIILFQRIMTVVDNINANAMPLAA